MMSQVFIVSIFSKQYDAVQIMEQYITNNSHVWKQYFFPHARHHKP